MCSDRGEFENCYLQFKASLEVLASSPEDACELLGHYNVSFETKWDLGFAQNLLAFDESPLNAKQRQGITMLIEALERVPAEVLAFTDVPSESLEKMKHPVWIPLRAMATKLLSDLEPVSRENQRYFANCERKGPRPS
jgi:hypothetical protein